MSVIVAVGEKISKTLVRDGEGKPMVLLIKNFQTSEKLVEKNQKTDLLVKKTTC